MNSETGTPINAELVHWSGPHGLPRFDLISDDDFEPAFDAALAEAEAAHEAIAGNPAAPDFANTVAAMEKADEALKRNWLPDDKRIWQHSKMLNPHETQDLRFTAPVFPGETLRAEIWRDGSFRARVVERDVRLP